jgi:hypothetical protein
MSRLFKSTFGAALVTEPLTPAATMYPSPMDLRGRIIIKHKKLGSGSGEATTARQDDISASNLQEELFVEDQVDHSWAKVHALVVNWSLLLFLVSFADA